MTSTINARERVQAAGALRLVVLTKRTQPKPNVIRVFTPKMQKRRDLPRFDQARPDETNPPHQSTHLRPAFFAPKSVRYQRYRRRLCALRAQPAGLLAWELVMSMVMDRKSDQKSANRLRLLDL